MVLSTAVVESGSGWGASDVSSASSSSSAIVDPATNRGKRWGVLAEGISALFTITAVAEEWDPVEVLGGEVKRLLPDAAVLPSAVSRRLFESAWDRALASEAEEDDDVLDLGQENLFEVNEVVAAAESELPEYILELAKVEKDDEDGGEE